MAFSGLKQSICFQLIVYLLYNSVSSTLSLGLLKPGNLQKYIIRFCSVFLNYYSSGETFILAEVANCSPQDRNKTQSHSCKEIACWSPSACCSDYRKGLHHLSLLSFSSWREGRARYLPRPTELVLLLGLADVPGSQHKPSRSSLCLLHTNEMIWVKLGMIFQSVRKGREWLNIEINRYYWEEKWTEKKGFWKH